MNALVKNITSPAYQVITVEPQSVYTGAEISGVDLSRPLTPQAVAEIRAALLQWKVIFFRDQPLSHEQHVAFGKQFGDLTVGHPVFGFVEGHPHIYSVGRNRLKERFTDERLVRSWTGWHTDVTAAVNPPFASILRGVSIPPYGGDTQWTNLVAAYQGLSPTLRSFVDTLKGEHRFTVPEGGGARPEFTQKVAATPLVSHHPLVRVHPETGERALYVSPSFLKRIVGLQPRESEQLLALLFEHVVRPEYTVRFKWREGSLAFWDNRSTAHLAPVDIFDTDFDRQLYRITLVGDVPVGPDGVASVAIEGKPVIAHSVE
ncbi:TauD/TfdA family dioxygenase [Herbaspirillum sp. RTI4]|uniref:TauD/TfdA dioxygenase family protein n=1 Tax=Herbaspirillum sp. RTI4 TaxID=3048640 RepID=UPI002AB55838|nr:TauD/TfdA family dioxygenase [Herbaspirillum sp. RTI4]MDY7578819.1 TauD/TfdA family dioxygenase [Herbaspirillum sp. RTI4]MEA9982673.1 TauD/TfdA family dioxygenase [Herbaspirillum sp. RTI4]